jgi:phage head maturation protease
VISSWKHDGRLDILIDVNSDNIEAAIINEFVRTGKCQEFSLGYKVNMSASSNGSLISTGKKEAVEVSIVTKGARNNCKIRGFAGPAHNHSTC